MLPQLYNLFLENNRFSGPLPPYIGAVNGSLPYLQELDLSNNRCSLMHDSVFDMAAELIFMRHGCQTTET